MCVIPGIRGPASISLLCLFQQFSVPQFFLRLTEAVVLLDVLRFLSQGIDLLANQFSIYELRVSVPELEVGPPASKKFNRNCPQSLQTVSGIQH
jgi:hypothetical protein